MDINADGKLDILSGSYSRKTSDMAGLFQVFTGTKDGGFSGPTVLKGSDGKELLLPAGEEDQDITQICTRPTAVDLNSDGHLDIVSGNFLGSFYVFYGTGEGRFSPVAQEMKTVDQKPLIVPYHSDPFFVDWDQDGDLDLLSGASNGGVYLSVNEGDKEIPKWSSPVILVEEEPYPEPDVVRFGDAHVKGPQEATRVWADDVNGDGKLDLLVGDNVTILSPAEGLSEKEARKRKQAHQLRLAEAHERKEKGEKVNMAELWQELDQIIKSESHGSVWLYLRN